MRKASERNKLSIWPVLGLSTGADGMSLTDGFRCIVVTSIQGDV